jgi:hypothetical protein
VKVPKQGTLLDHCYDHFAQTHLWGGKASHGEAEATIWSTILLISKHIALQAVLTSPLIAFCIQNDHTAQPMITLPSGYSYHYGSPYQNMP